MTRKDFILIAKTIAELDQTQFYARDTVAHSFAAVLAQTNPLFDRARFLAACGVDT